MRKCSKMVMSVVFAIALLVCGAAYFITPVAYKADGETATESETYSLGDVVGWQVEDGFTAHKAKYTTTNLAISSGSAMDATKADLNLKPFTGLNGKDGDNDKVVSSGNSTWCTVWQYQLGRPDDTSGDIVTSVVAVIKADREIELTLGVAENESVFGFIDWNSCYKVTMIEKEGNVRVLADYGHCDTADQLKAHIAEKLTVNMLEGDAVYVELYSAQDRNFQNINQYKITATPIVDSTIGATENYSEIVKEAIANKSNVIERSGYKMSFLSGIPAKGALNAMNAFGEDYLAYSVSETIKDTNNDTDAYFQPWQYKSGGQDKAAVIAFTPEKNVKIEVRTLATVATDANGNLYDWSSETGSKYNYYIAGTDSKATKVYSKNVPPVSAANEHGYVAHVKAGETFYFTFASDFGVISQIPDFILSEADYDEEWTYEPVLAEKEILNGSTMITDVIANDLNDVETDHVVYGFRYGTVGGVLNEFEYHAGIGDGDWHDALLDSVYTPDDDSRYGNAFWRWQIRCSGLDQSVVMLKAKNNVFVDLTHAANNGLNTQGANFKIVVEDENGILITLKDLPTTLIVEENQYGLGVHLKAGDTLYFVMYCPAGGNNTVTTWMVPVFTITPSLYDESKRANFGYQIELNEYKEEQKAAIDAYVAALSSADYSDVNWLAIEDYALVYKERIEAASKKENVTELFAAAKEAIDGVPTKAEEEAELNAFKAEKKQYVEKYANKSDYSSSDWEKIVALKEEALEKIENASTIADVNAAVSGYVNALSRIEKVSDDGCDSSVSTNLSLIVLLALAAVVVMAKKRSVRR